MPVLFTQKGDTVGQEVMDGACASFTRTVKEHLCPEVELTFTVVVPTGKKDPEAGVEVMVPQLPVVVGAA